MQETLQLNGREVGFANHPTEGTVYLKGALDTRVSIRLGKVYFNLLSPSLDLSEYLDDGAPDYYRERVPYFRLATYQPIAVPGGAYGTEIRFPTGDHATDLWVYGLPGHEKFHGTVTVHEGYLEFRGEIVTNEGQRLFAVEGRKTFTPRPLLPLRKRYQLAEARNVPPLEVYELQVGEGEYTTFPEEVLAFKNLEYLWFGGQARVAFTELPRGLFELTQLRSLFFYQHRLLRIAPEIGRLHRLEELTFSYGPLTEVPPEIGQLPMLRRLELRYNQLAALPESIAALPELDTLELPGNAFKTLPAGLAGVPNLKLDRKFRKLYTDDSYVSANPAAVDHSLFTLDRYPEAKQALAETIEATPELQPGRDLLLHYARMATYLVPGEKDEDIPLGASKLGGAPDLPVGTEHPSGEGGKLLVFHAQLNCAELAPYQAYLPRTGMLYFYVTDEEMVRQATVRYVPTTDALYRVAYTEATEFTDADLNGCWREAVAIRPQNAVSLPELYNAANHGAERFPAVAALFDEDDSKPGVLSDDELEELDDAIRTLAEGSPDTPRQQLPFTAREVHSVNAYVFTQHESPEERAAAQFGGEPADYLTLLNLESLGEFSFWDAGTLTYCVHKKDLAIGVFERVGAYIESS